MRCDLGNDHSYRPYGDSRSSMRTSIRARTTNTNTMSRALTRLVPCAAERAPPARQRPRRRPRTPPRRRVASSQSRRSVRLAVGCRGRLVQATAERGAGPARTGRPGQPQRAGGQPPRALRVPSRQGAAVPDLAGRRRRALRAAQGGGAGAHGSDCVPLQRQVRGGRSSLPHPSPVSPSLPPHSPLPITLTLSLSLSASAVPICHIGLPYPSLHPFLPRFPFCPSLPGPDSLPALLLSLRPSHSLPSSLPFSRFSNCLFRFGLRWLRSGSFYRTSSCHSTFLGPEPRHSATA